MVEQWLRVLESLSLSPIDLETVESFRQKPQGRSFLAVSDILTKHHKDEEAFQLLLYGLNLHPSYSAARVILAQAMFERSIFAESWRVLEDSPIDLRENKTAQILRFRLALLLGYEDRVLQIKHEMQSLNQLEGAILRLAEELEMKSFSNVRLGFIQVAKAEGFDVSSLEFDHIEDTGASSATSNDSIQVQAMEDADDPVLIERLIDGFYVAPINEIFSKTEEEQIPDDEHHNLDAVTLAQVYRKQARYQKALEIYQKLLYMAPNNDLYKKQVEELTALREEQKEKERRFDPDLVERLDEVQVIEQKIVFLNRILARLDKNESTQDLSDTSG